MSKDNRNLFTYKGVEVEPAGIFGPRQSFGQIDQHKEIKGRVYSRWWRVYIASGFVNAATKAHARQIIDACTDSPKAKEIPCG